MTPDQAAIVIARALLHEAWVQTTINGQHWLVRDLPLDVWQRVNTLADVLVEPPDDDEVEGARECLLVYAEGPGDMVLVPRRALADTLAHLDGCAEHTGGEPCQASFTTVVRRALDH